MTYNEGVLKKVEICSNESKDSHFIYIEYLPFGEVIVQKIAIDAQVFLEKILLNEKISVAEWEEEDTEDYVQIRGVVKNIPLLAKYN
jgi:hypothetical protein